MYSRDLLNKANSGNAEAMHEIALAYMEGDGVEKDMEKAIFWSEKAANLGIVDAQMNMAAAGHFMDDMDMKFYWLQKAAASGHTGAKYALADYYLLGDGTPQDISKAIYWLQQASNEGSAEAKRKLGAAYIEGIGVSPDEEKGMSLLHEAASLGDDEAKELLRQVSSGQLSTKPSSVGGGSSDSNHLAYILHNLEDDLPEQEKKQKQLALAGDRDYQYIIGVYYYVRYTQNDDSDDLAAGLGFLAESAKQGSRDALEHFEEEGLDWREWVIGLPTSGSSSSSRVSSNSSSSSKGGCYIATCVYGSYDCPEVWTLRRFRDNTLSLSYFGRMFIEFYYAVSPKLVGLFGSKKWFNKMMKPVLDRIVARLQSGGTDSNLYYDK